MPYGDGRSAPKAFGANAKRAFTTAITTGPYAAGRGAAGAGGADGADGDAGSGRVEVVGSSHPPTSATPCSLSLSKHLSNSCHRFGARALPGASSPPKPPDRESRLSSRISPRRAAPFLCYTPPPTCHACLSQMTTPRAVRRSCRFGTCARRPSSRRTGGRVSVSERELTCRQQSTTHWREFYLMWRFSLCLRRIAPTFSTTG